MRRAVNHRITHSKAPLVIFDSTSILRFGEDEVPYASLLVENGEDLGVEASSSRNGGGKRVDAFNGFWRGSYLPLGKLVINESLLFLTCPVVASCLSCLPGVVWIQCGERW